MKQTLLYFVLLISSAVFAQIPTTGLNANYDFTNGSLVDAISGNNFIQTGSALANVDDRFNTTNNAISLNGDYLTRGDIDFPNDAFNIGNEATISFWIKTTTTDGNARTIFEDTNGRSNQTDPTWTGYYIYLKDGKIGFSLGVLYNTSFGHKYAGLLTTKIVNDDTWHHVVFLIYNSLSTSSSGATDTARNIGTIYIDGENMGSAGDIRNAQAGNVYLAESHDTAGNILIGNNRTNTLPDINRYQDAIDDVNIYTRNLTATEITQLNDNNFCFAPNSSILSTSNITNTSATINISDSDTYDIAYHKSSEPFSNATIVTGIALGTTDLTSLEVFTNYDVYVRKQCTINSAWSIPITFRTTRPIGRLYVKAGATGQNNGQSWTNALTSLKEAIDVAISGEEIWIAAGVYTPDSSDRTIAFNIDASGTKIYGGFDGTETSISQRDIIANPTILSGDLQGNDDANVTFNNATRTDNSYHVVDVSVDNVLIDGVIITSGYADDTATSGTNRLGAGIIKAGLTTNFKIMNTTIKDNVAYWGSGFATDTASLVGNTTIAIENCVFDNNLSSATGSAFYITPFASTTSNITVVNCLIKNNKTTNDGSRIGNGGSAGHIRAYYGNAVINATIVNNTIVNNSNEGTGTSDYSTFGLSNQNGSFGTVTIANNIFWGNTKNGGLTSTAFGRISDANFPNGTTIYNSIDEDDYSNFSTKVATSNSDPLFINVSNFRLQSISPAIDSGDNTKVPVNSVTDLLGHNRIYNTTVDIGAYEYDPNTLGLSENNELRAFSVFPNPTKGNIYINSNEAIEKIEIYSYLGQKLIESDDNSIDANNLSAGMYLIKVYATNGKIGVKRFVKQ